MSASNVGLSAIFLHEDHSRSCSSAVSRRRCSADFRSNSRALFVCSPYGLRRRRLAGCARRVLPEFLGRRDADAKRLGQGLDQRLDSEIREARLDDVGDDRARAILVERFQFGNARDDRIAIWASPSLVQWNSRYRLDAVGEVLVSHEISAFCARCRWRLRRPGRHRHRDRASFGEPAPPCLARRGKALAVLIVIGGNAHPAGLRR